MGIEYKLDDTTTDSFIIFSAFHFLEDSETNAENTNYVEALLQSKGIAFRKIYGKYREGFEYSFVVNADHLQMVKSIANKYHQECIMLVGEPVSHDVRPVQVHYIESGVIAPMGFLTEVNMDRAFSNDDYIYDYELDQYYVTIPEIANVVHSKSSI